MKEVKVIGCGIVGLTTAIALQEKGIDVCIYAQEKPMQTLSSKVGAIWYPYEVHPIDKANAWASNAYQRYLDESKHCNGVSFIPFTVVVEPDGDHSWTKKLPENAVRLATKSELPKGAKMAYVATVPLAEPPIYLPELWQRFVDNGGEFVAKTFTTISQISKLGDFVVNCTGLGAKELCNDQELKSMRGQILRAEKMDLQSAVTSTSKGALSYLIQRSEDCILGGTDYDDDYNLNVEESDTNLILSRLMESGIVKEKPSIIEAVVGLRPKRKEVRFEYDQTFNNVFHNYGHGGAGFTVAWGCALDVADEILKKVVN